MTKRILTVLMVVALIGGMLATTALDAGAKKKKKKKPKSKVCAPYAPGEQGADAETTVVTDKATEEAPVEVTLTAEPGAGTLFEGIEIGAISHVFHNVQVDSKAKTTGLWVRLEIPEYEDYDLYLNNPDGTTASKASGFNAHTEGSPLAYNDTSSGGHTENGAEQLDGIKSSDCQGYTVDVAAATAPGGDVTLKFWLGDANYDPAAPPA